MLNNGKVRIAALSLLMSLLDGSKQFLVAADDRHGIVYDDGSCFVLTMLFLS